MDTRSRTNSLFSAPRALIGMVHIGALPGTPRSHESIDALIERAVAEARIYRDAGFHAVMIENMHDTPYLRREVGPEITAAMAAIAREVRRAVDLPLGIQILAGANREAIAVAQASGAGFVRVEGYVFAHVADEGILEGDAGELLRYRRAIGAENVLVFADIKKKHAAHAITADVGLVETARAAEFFHVDAAIVTGSETGRAADPDEVAAVKRSVAIPVLVGSGVTPENLERYAGADGVIVGSAMKQDGHWVNAVDPGRVEAMARAFAALPKPE